MHIKTTVRYYHRMVTIKKNLQIIAGQSVHLGGPSPLAMRRAVPRPGWRVVEQRNQQPQTVSETRHKRLDWSTNGPSTNGPSLDHAASQEIPSGFGRGLIVELAASCSPATALELGVSWAPPAPFPRAVEEGREAADGPETGPSPGVEGGGFHSEQKGVDRKAQHRKGCNDQAPG